MIRMPYFVCGTVKRHLTEMLDGIFLEILGFDGVPYPCVRCYGAGVDRNTGAMHGPLLIPREGQVVGLLMEVGDLLKVTACFPLPYTVDDRGYVKTLDQQFETASGGTFNDIIYSHYKGQRIIQRDDGSTEIQSKEVGGNRTVITMDASGNVKIDLMAGTKIELGQGALSGVVTETKLNQVFNTALTGLKAYIEGHVHPETGATTLAPSALVPLGVTLPAPDFTGSGSTNVEAIP